MSRVVWILILSLMLIWMASSAVTMSLVDVVQEREILDPGGRIVSVAEVVLDRYEGGDLTPSYGKVTFLSANERYMCQGNVRYLVEASIFGRSGTWSEASCCAMATCVSLRAAALRGEYVEIEDLSDVRPGDLVYLSGGPRCHSCGRGAGHAMVCTGRGPDGTLMMWQNTTFGGTRGLNELPLMPGQASRFASAFRIPKVCDGVSMEPVEPLVVDAPSIRPVRVGPIHLGLAKLVGEVVNIVSGGSFDEARPAVAVDPPSADVDRLRREAQRAWLAGDSGGGVES